MTTNPSELHTHDLPADLRSLDAALASLAEADRAAAPADLEARVFAATRESLIPAPLPITHSGQPGRVSTRFFTPMRLAAGLALAASLGAAILASRSGPAMSTHTDPIIAQQPALSADSLDTLFAIAKGSDDAIGTEIDLIAADADVFSSNLSPISWSLDEGATSSM
ncbi:MAG: hypothetical protein SFY95_01840 [Planctomycetota bacterium]|nr:hypothetical protein [Planctomycetota bacterium]